MVEDDDLRDNHLGGSERVVLGVRSNVFSYYILDGKILEDSTKVVTWYGGLKLLVMHHDGLDLSGCVHGYDNDSHTGLRGTVLKQADGHYTCTIYLVDEL